MLLGISSYIMIKTIKAEGKIKRFKGVLKRVIIKKAFWCIHNNLFLIVL